MVTIWINIKDYFILHVISLKYIRVIIVKIITLSWAGYNVCRCNISDNHKRFRWVIDLYNSMYILCEVTQYEF